MKFEPKPYQPIMLKHLLTHKRGALWVPMGMGKTSTCLWLLSILKLVEPCRTLVIAPLRVAQFVWPADGQKFEEFAELKIVSITGSALERSVALKIDADIHTINYENLPWLVAKNYWPWNVVIADESTKLKSFRLKKGSIRAKALGKATFNSKVERFYELTGTPSPNGLQDLWGQLWFLDHGERLGRTYTNFIQRWFRPKHLNSFEMVPLPHTQVEIQARVQDICLSLEVKDWFDVKDALIIDVPVELPTQAMSTYRQMEKMFFAEVVKQGAAVEVEAANAASKSIKCLQLANGAIYTDDKGAWAPTHDAKLEALESIIAESGGTPIIVVYHFKSDLQRLMVRFPTGKCFDGNGSRVEAWNKGCIPILFVHPDSAGHGLNLQHGGNIIVFFGHWWDLEKYQQVIERIGPVRQMQSGYNRPVFIYNIRAENTIDELVIQSRTDKRKVQDLLLDYARRKA